MHTKKQTEIIFDRAVSLFALTCVAAYDYGVRIWILFGIAAAVSLLTELLCLRLRGAKFTRRHLDAAVSGVLLLMLLPPSVPVSVLIMSCIFANIISRGVFNEMENPVIPSAAVGFCFAMLNQRSAVTSFPSEKYALPFFIPDTEALVAGISDQWNRTGTFSASAVELITGLTRQPIGSASLILLAVIAIVLMLRRSASAWVVLPALIASAVCDLLMSNLRAPLLYSAACCLTNQLLFAVIFLFGDPRYAPPPLAGMISGAFSGILFAVFTRILYVYDAPVFLAVMLSPVMILLRRLTMETDAQPKGGSQTHEAVSTAKPQ